MQVELKRFKPEYYYEFMRRGPRQADEQEAVRVYGLPLADVLGITLKHAEVAGGIFVAEKIVALVGVNSLSLLRHTGNPWLVAHEDFERNKTATAMGRICKRLVERWATVYPELENIIDPANKKAVSFLKRLGFRFAWNTPLKGPYGHQLVRFRLESKSD